MSKIRFIDSHTGGEPTRVVPSGEIVIEGRTMKERSDFLRTHQDHFRTGILLEPRGSDVIVGAFLTPPVHPSSLSGVVFCNNDSYLGMCGHGAIGVLATLSYLGTIGPGQYNLDTPAGTVSATLKSNGEVEIANVPSYRYLSNVCLDLPNGTKLSGNVCYGGNWFFITEMTRIPISLDNRTQLNHLCQEIKGALEAQSITGENGAKVDHIELSQPSNSADSDSVNYILCPGDQFDRSPCGTGTSAKVAALIEDGLLAPGTWYVQQSVTGSRFRAKGELLDGRVIPTISGQAWVIADGHLIFSDDDPLRWGLR